MKQDYNIFPPELRKKYEELKSYLSLLESVAVAFSAGVDSTFLLYAAKEVLSDNVIAATVVSNFISGREVEESEQICRDLGVKHVILRVDVDDIPRFTENPVDRCYHCKKSIFTGLKNIAMGEHKDFVVDGSNADDVGDYRPGMRALAELEIKSPLKEVGLTKSEIRQLSECFGLPTFNKPSFACLASRIPYGNTISKEKLLKVEKAENLLLELGFKQFRVRLHGEEDKNAVARIELLPEDFERLMDIQLREKIYQSFKDFGFAYTALDLKGYRTGSLNETINEE